MHEKTVEKVVRDLLKNDIGVKVDGGQLSKMHPKLKQAGSFVNSIERVKEGLKIDLTFTARAALKLTDHTIPNNSTFKIINLTNYGALKVIGPQNAKLFDKPFNIFLKGDLYSFDGKKWFKIFKN